MKNQYDEIIGKKYSEASGKRISRAYAVDPSFLKAIGDVHGKKVLDLACGSGEFTRACCIINRYPPSQKRLLIFLAFRKHSLPLLHHEHIKQFF